MALSEDIRILTIVRKFIIDLSLCSYRDLKFFLQGDNKEQRRKIYNKDLEYEEGKRYSVVCNNFCIMIKNYLVSKYGFDVEVITCDNDEFGHRDILVTIGSNKYIINCLSDLERNQMGMRPLRFASKEYVIERYPNYRDITFLSSEEVMNIDKNIGFYNEFYFDDVVDVLKCELNNFSDYIKTDSGFYDNLVSGVNVDCCDDELKLKILFLCKFFNQRYGLIGHIEFMRIYKLLFKNLFTKDELKNIKLDNCFFDKKDNVKYDNLFECKEDRVRFITITVFDTVFVISVSSSEYIMMSMDEWNSFKLDNNVFSNSMINSSLSISEVLRNKGIGVNILKHYIVKNKLNFLDSLFLNSKSSCEINSYLDNLVKQGTFVDLGNYLGVSYKVNLLSDRIEFYIGNEVILYYYYNDNLVEECLNNSSCKSVYLFKDEGVYDKCEFVVSKVKKIC